VPDPRELSREELLAALAERDAVIAALLAEIEQLKRRVGMDSLLTEQGPVFPQLESLAVTLGYTVTARG